MLSGAEEDERYALSQERRQETAEALDVFAKRFGFSLGEVADLLLDLRTSDPVTFVLLMSREYKLALERCPDLNKREQDAGIVPARLPNFRNRRIVALMTVAELQRLIAMLRDLHRTGSVTSSRDLRATVRAPGATKPQRGAKIAKAIANKTGVGRAIEQSPLHADAVRRLLRLRNRRAAELDPDAIYRALAEGRIDYDQASSALTLVGAHELIATAIAPEIMKRSTLGRGHSYPDIDLAMWYGIDGFTLHYLALIELGSAISGSKSRQQCTTLAICMLDRVTGDRKSSEINADRRHGQASTLVHHYLRRYSRLGSNARFAASAWLDPHRDAALFGWLSTPVNLDNPKLKRDGVRWLIALAMHLLRQEFTKLYGNIVVVPAALDVAAELATGVSVFTSDPVMHAIMKRAIEADKVNRAKRVTDARANTEIKVPSTTMAQVERAIDEAAGRPRSDSIA